MESEQLTSLCCLKCGKLYASVHKSSEDDDRVPCIGSCLHSICIFCITSLDSPNCPICEKQDAFNELIINNTAIDFLSAIREQMTTEKREEMTENMNNLKNKNCDTHSEKLQFCLTCVQSQNSKILKKISPTEKRIWLPSEENILLFCEKCARAEHEEHEFISIEDVENLEDILELDTILSFPHFHTSSHQNVFEYFERVAGEHEKLLKNCETLKKETHSCNLNAFRQNIQSEARKTAVEFINLKKMQLVFHKEHLTNFMSFYENQLNEVKEKENQLRLQNIFEKLKVINEKLSETPENWFDPDEIKLIDEEIEKRMLSLESTYRSKSFIKVENVPDFFKYRALLNELKGSNQDLQRAEIKFNDRKENVKEYCLKQRPFVQNLMKAEEILNVNKESFEPNYYHNRKDYIESFYDIILMDQSAEKSGIDNLTLECNRTSVRKQYAELMFLKYFPPTVDSEMLNYFELIRQFKYENEIL